MIRRRAAALAIFLAACSTPKTPGGPATPTPFPAVEVPEGYSGIGWGTLRARVQASDAALKPSKTNPKVLVRETTRNKMPATEAFFFDDQGALEEVELRFTPKRSPTEAADLAHSMDGAMGAHEVPLADENGYQFAWLGQGTEVRFSYDLRESVAFGPVVAWTPLGLDVAPAVSPTAPATPVKAGDAGACFAGAIHAARGAGMHLVAVEAARGKLALVFEGSGHAKEITLSADPKGRLLGCATLARAATGASLQLAAEGALDGLFAHDGPTALEFGGPAGLADLVTLRSRDGWVSLHPGPGDALAGRSANKPR